MSIQAYCNIKMIILLLSNNNKMLSEILLNVQILSVILEIPFINLKDHFYVNKYVRKIIPTDDIFKVKPLGKNKILSQKIIQKIMEEKFISYYESFLLLAIKWKDLHTYYLLINNGIKKSRKMHYNILTFVIATGSIKFIKFYMIFHFEVFFLTEIYKYDLLVYKLLIIHSDYYLKSKIYTFESVEHGTSDILKFLHYKSTKLMFDNYCLLSLACDVGNVEIVKFLLKIGADKNAKKGTPLLKACYKNRIKVIKILLAKNANVFHRALGFPFFQFPKIKKLVGIFREGKIDRN